MKSKVSTMIDYRQIPVQAELLQIEIPSWEAVAQPLVQQALKQYEEVSQEYTSVLTDEMVQALNLPNIESVHDLKRYGMDFYSRILKEARIEKDILPLVLNYYVEHSAVVLNSDERDLYVEDYINQVDQLAEAKGLSLEVYVKEHLFIEGDPIDALEKEAEKVFIFKVIAHQYYQDQGYELDRLTYEEFIQKQVLHNQADEIELRDRFSYDQFVNEMPEMILSQEIFDYFYDEIEFIINPNQQS